MTVNSDRWIRRTAEETAFIQPFDAALVREVDGRRIIPAKVSSSGDDLRPAADGSRYYPVPPHSYAHGVAVETFELSRDVTGSGTGKSAYSQFSKLISRTVRG